MKATVEDITLFTSAMWLSMPRAEYDQLPDRQNISTLPVDGVMYRDRAHPGIVFRCGTDANWSRYRYTALKPELI